MQRRLPRRVNNLRSFALTLTSYRSFLFIPSPDLFSFLGVMIDIVSRYSIDPEEISVIKLRNEDASFIVRDHADIARRCVVVKPRRVIFGKLNVDGFQPAFLRIIYGCFHLFFPVQWLLIHRGSGPPPASLPPGLCFGGRWLAVFLHNFRRGHPDMFR